MEAGIHRWKIFATCEISLGTQTPIHINLRTGNKEGTESAQTPCLFTSSPQPTSSIHGYQQQFPPYKWIYERSYIWAAEKDMNVWLIIAITHTTYAVVKLKAKKNSGLNGIRTYDLCDQCSALLTELSSHLGASHIVSSQYTCRKWRMYTIWILGFQLTS